MITDSLTLFLGSTLHLGFRKNEGSNLFAYRFTLLDLIGVEAWATMLAETLDSCHLARDTLANTANGARFPSTQIKFIDNSPWCYLHTG